MVTSVKTFFTSFRACAQEDCTFVPEGYITESASIKQIAQKDKSKQETSVDLLTRLKTEFPEVYAILTQKNKYSKINRRMAKTMCLFVLRRYVPLIIYVCANSVPTG